MCTANDSKYWLLVFYQTLSTTIKVSLLNFENNKYALYRKPKPRTTVKQISKFLEKASGNAVDKSVEMFSDSQTKINEDYNEKLEIYGSIYRSRSLIASMSLNNRRVQKSIESYERVMATGEPDSYLRTTLDWLEIHALFVWEVIWGAVATLLSMIFTLVVQLVVTVAVTALIFWLIWWFIML